jgi:cell division protein FtsL
MRHPAIKTKKNHQKMLALCALMLITFASSIGLIYIKYLNRRLSVASMNMNLIKNQLDDHYNQLIRLKNQRINPHTVEVKAASKRHMIHTTERNTRLIFHHSKEIPV